MIEKMIFQKTPYHTLRVFVYGKDIEKYTNIESLFNLLSSWGGCDKKDNDYKSWEFTLTLTEYFKEKFMMVNFPVEFYGL